jgi:hypothetical protein
VDSDGICRYSFAAQLALLPRGLSCPHTAEPSTPCGMEVRTDMAAKKKAAKKKAAKKK